MNYLNGPCPPGTRAADEQPLLAHVTGRLGAAIEVTGQSLENLRNFNDRVLGCQPVAHSDNKTGGMAGHHAGDITAQLETLLTLVEQLSSQVARTSRIG